MLELRKGLIREQCPSQCKEEQKNRSFNEQETYPEGKIEDINDGQAFIDEKVMEEGNFSNKQQEVQTEEGLETEAYLEDKEEIVGEIKDNYVAEESLFKNYENKIENMQIESFNNTVHEGLISKKVLGEGNSSNKQQEVQNEEELETEEYLEDEEEKEEEIKDDNGNISINEETTPDQPFPETINGYTKNVTRKEGNKISDMVEGIYTQDKVEEQHEASQKVNENIINENKNNEKDTNYENKDNEDNTNNEHMANKVNEEIGHNENDYNSNNEETATDQTFLDTVKGHIQNVFSQGGNMINDMAGGIYTQDEVNDQQEASHKVNENKNNEENTNYENKDNEENIKNENITNNVNEEIGGNENDYNSVNEETTTYQPFLDTVKGYTKNITRKGGDTINDMVRGIYTQNEVKDQQEASHKVNENIINENKSNEENINNENMAKNVNEELGHNENDNNVNEENTTNPPFLNTVKGYLQNETREGSYMINENVEGIHTQDKVNDQQAASHQVNENIIDENKGNEDINNEHAANKVNKEFGHNKNYDKSLVSDLKEETKDKKVNKKYINQEENEDNARKISHSNTKTTKIKEDNYITYATDIQEVEAEENLYDVEKGTMSHKLGKDVDNKASTVPESLLEENSQFINPVKENTTSDSNINMLMRNTNEQVASSLTQTMDPTEDVESAKHHGSNASNTEELGKRCVTLLQVFKLVVIVLWS